MRFSIFSHAEHYEEAGKLYSYGPYVKEMNLWIANIENIKVVAPSDSRKRSAIDKAYQHVNIELVKIPKLHYKGTALCRSLTNSWEILRVCYSEMKAADHIHIRCPGNVGMLAIVVSSFFPNKSKTVKYAGNWDPESKQPLSYRFQKWWLSNTFLSRNVKVLVYGNWENQSRNIIPFFTASFSEREKEAVKKEFKSPFRFLFCGSLVEGKRPLLAVKIIDQLYRNGYQVKLDIYGEGPERMKVVDYIEKNDLQGVIKLHGNQPQETLEGAYRGAQFCVLPSKSEGWPKALAEGMFFGCIPIGTEISCVPWMLGGGTRGLLLTPPLAPTGGGRVVEKIRRLLEDEEAMLMMSQRAQEWSQEYTLEKFKYEIHKLL